MISFKLVLRSFQKTNEQLLIIRKELDVLKGHILTSGVTFDSVGFDLRVLLKLSKRQIDSFIALKTLGGTSTATEVARFLNIHRADASQSLNNLCRISKYINKERIGRKIYFNLRGTE